MSGGRAARGPTLDGGAEGAAAFPRSVRPVAAEHDAQVARVVGGGEGGGPVARARLRQPPAQRAAVEVVDAPRRLALVARRAFLDPHHHRLGRAVRLQLEGPYVNG